MVTSNAIAQIDQSALCSNLQRVKAYAPTSRILAVIKANAYGHGVANVLEAFSHADAFAVANIDEALALAKFNPTKPIVILQGVITQEELLLCQQYDFQPTIHSLYQVEQIKQLPNKIRLSCWIKIDTGMHRLGLSIADYQVFQEQIAHIPNIKPVVLMSHFSCANEPSRHETHAQIKCFDAIADQYRTHQAQSLCNSAGIIHFPKAHRDWVRPGIMLYGVSPDLEQTAVNYHLNPVMSLKARLIAIKRVSAGEAIGYGGTWHCPDNRRIGVVGIGYGDGYPYHAPSGTPVLINNRRCPLVGSVSMDMITVDLTQLPQAKVGDQAILWGQGLPVEEVAYAARTIAYELIARLTKRVSYQTL